MQTRNGNVAAMDKRVDLGSLFCMIGRHGPAVAVAVIAVVSVLAGLIIYRNVKRRKAADDDAGGVPDSSLRYQESNPLESRSRSTDVSKEDLSNYEEAHLPEIPCSIRNRRTVCHKETLLHHPTEKVSAHQEMHTSTLSQRCRSMMEPSLQDSDKTLKDDWMTADVASVDHVEDELRSSKPVIGGPHQDESEVPKSQEDEILEMFVWDAETSQEKVLSSMTTTSSSVSDTGTGHCHNIEKSQETDQMLHDAKTSRESDLKEVACDADVVNSCQGQEVKCNTHHLECNRDKLKIKSPERFDQVTSSEFEIRKVIEEDVAQHLNDAAKVQNISPQQTATCRGWGIEMVSHDKQNHSVVAPFPLLLLQPTDLQSDHTCIVHPTHCLSQLVVGDERSLNWCKDTKLVPLCGKETRGEKNEDDTDPSMDHLVSSSYKVLEETYCEEANPGIPPEMGWIAGSFEEQKNNQMPSTDLPEFGTISNADDACQIGFEKDELMCLSGAGRESGISSMTASLYLQEANYDPPTENVALSGTDLYPSFEEQTNAENTLFDGDKIAGEIRKDASNTSGTCLSMQHINGREQNVMDQFGEGEMLTIELKQGGIKKVENRENNGAVKANNGKTEISIREATMDTEWMVDDEEAQPWVNPCDPIVVKHLQTNHRCCSSLSEVEVSSDNEVKQTNTLYFVGGNGEKSNKVVAVQPMSQFVDVTFHIHYVTQSLYQKVAITGNQQELGNWKGFVPLEKTKDGHWATVVSLPAESHVEWKFVVVDKGEVCRWEECGNRLLETGSGEDLLIQKWWGFL